MARLGVFCYPGTGHLNPMTALARRLQERGHSVVIFGIADVESRVNAAGIEFCLIGESDFPPGTLKKLDRHHSELKGLKVFHFTIERIKNTARMVLRDGPDAVRRMEVEALLVDESDFGGNVAEYLGLPFVSVACIPPLIRGDQYPPFCFGWGAGLDWRSRLRNRFGIRLLTRVADPVFAAINEQREAWGLGPQTAAGGFLSPLLRVTQLPRVLEFEVGDPPALVKYTGPFVDHQQRTLVEFPWERLDGRPLVYASLGTMQNGSEAIFRTIAAACAGLHVQLVISLGGGLDEEQLGVLAGDPVVVRFAPQLEIVKRASAVITHAGLNTVLESLAEGLPLVCIPLGNDQPGVAARVSARGAGIVVSRRRLNATRLRSAVKAILEDGKYRRAARVIQAAIQEVDGLEQASDLIEDALKIKVRIPA
ncbi:MAG: nucleotide disphospho-sugar-binding domain-containing protein [Terracidiphilus sp.]